MIRTRLVALTIAGLLAVSTLAASQPAIGRGAAPRGASGIGDDYFPLDGNGGIDVLSYNIADRYRFGSGRLSGVTKIRLKATETLASFNLDFLLPVDAVRVDGKVVDFEKSRHELVIHRRVSSEEVISVRVRYAGRPSSYSYAGESNWLASDEEVVAMNQPHMAPWWFPSNDHPQDRAKMTISITAPQDKRVIANGSLVRRVVRHNLATTTWRAKPMVPYLAFFAAGTYAVARSNDYGIPSYVAVSKALSPTERETAMGLMKLTPKLLHWLTGLLGDYPFATTGGLTTSLDPGFALENQTRPTYPYWGDGNGAVVTVVHELAHQWFGDSVTVETWRDIWLNEGAATFMEWIYTEQRGGPSAQSELRDLYDPAGAGFWDLVVADPCPSGADDCVDWIFDGRVYRRGAMTLQALRNVIGDEDLWTLLRRWTTERAGETGSTAQFEALAEDVSGQDLSGFFDAWLHSSTKPADTAANGLG